MVEAAQDVAPMIRVEGLSKSFGQQAVLASVDFAVSQGEVLAILGRSGSGKSTLLRLLALLEKADEGQAWLAQKCYMRNGACTLDPVAIRRQVAMVFQHSNLIPNLSVEDNCSLGPVRARQSSPQEIKKNVRSLLQSIGVEHLSARYPETLSGGESQRVALVRALAMKPRVLLLDEVTSSLDPESIVAVLGAIRAVRQIDRSLTIVMVTHILSFAQSFSDRIAFLHSGKISDIATSKTFHNQKLSDPARLYVDAAARNWIE